MWQPTTDYIKKTNHYRIMQDKAMNDYQNFYNWSVDHPAEFWDITVQALQIKLKHPYSTAIDDSDLEKTIWLKDAKLNIVDTCFKANSTQTAIVYQKENDEKLTTISYGALESYVNQIANSLKIPAYNKAMLLGHNGCSMNTIITNRAT